MDSIFERITKLNNDYPEWRENDSYNIFRSGMQIADSINEAKGKLLRMVFEELENQMQPIAERYNLTKENQIGWYEYEKRANASFYSMGYSTYPGLNYIVNDATLNNGYQLWLRIEVDHTLFAGFCVFDPNGVSEEGKGNQVNQYDQSTRESVNSILNVSENEQSHWWATWWYLPTGGRRSNDKIPNFKSMNEIALSLADETKRKAFVEECIGQIEHSISRILR